jgi:hypothetical protein
MKVLIIRYLFIVLLAVFNLNALAISDFEIEQAATYSVGKVEIGNNRPNCYEEGNYQDGKLACGKAHFYLDALSKSTELSKVRQAEMTVMITMDPRDCRNEKRMAHFKHPCDEARYHFALSGVFNSDGERHHDYSSRDLKYRDFIKYLERILSKGYIWELGGLYDSLIKFNFNPFIVISAKPYHLKTGFLDRLLNQIIYEMNMRYRLGV